MKRGGLASLFAALLAACGGGGGGDNAPPPPPPPAVATLALVAGAVGGAGTADGAYAAARFVEPSGLGFDNGGTLYITEVGANRVRKAVAGMVTTFAGDGNVGSTDGSAMTARFYGPRGVATAVGQGLYVADWENHTIRQVTLAGVVSTLAGQAGQAGFADGTGAAARFNQPRAIVRDAVGNAIVADSVNCAIRKITPEGDVTTIAGSGSECGFRDGPALTARFNIPTALAIDDAGNLYIGDTGNHAIRKLSAAGEVTTIAGAPGRFGHDDGPAALASFEGPQGLALGLDGTIYVGDAYSHLIRQISPSGQVSTLAGSPLLSGSADGQGAAARFNVPAGLAVDSTTATLYVADSFNHTIRSVTRQGLVATAIGAPPPTGSADGSATAARFANTADLAVDAAGNVFVADTGNRAIRRVDVAGNVTTIAGSLGQYGTADGPLASARLGGPTGVTVDSAGTIYVVDHPVEALCHNPLFCDPVRSTLRKITATGVSTIAGSAELPQGTTDGPGATALFRVLDDVAVDAAGNLYVTDAKGPTIRKITPAGLVSTFAGLVDAAGFIDGTGAQARFREPHGIAIDGAGNLYVADNYTHIRKITPAGVVSTLASGFTSASRLSIDSDGNLYVSELNTIRKVTPGGVVTTIAGVPTIAGFTPGPLPGVVSPRSLVVSGRDLYIGIDAGVAVIRNRP